MVTVPSTGFIKGNAILKNAFISFSALWTKKELNLQNFYIKCLPSKFIWNWFDFFLFNPMQNRSENPPGLS